MGGGRSTGTTMEVGGGGGRREDHDGGGRRKDHDGGGRREDHDGGGRREYYRHDDGSEHAGRRLGPIADRGRNDRMRIGGRK